MTTAYTHRDLTGRDFFVVLVSSPKREFDSEVLFATESLREALRAIGALGVIAPELSCSIYCHPDLILTVRDGRWRVRTPKKLEAVA